MIAKKKYTASSGMNESHTLYVRGTNHSRRSSNCSSVAFISLILFIQSCTSAFPRNRMGSSNIQLTSIECPEKPGTLLDLRTKPLPYKESGKSFLLAGQLDGGNYDGYKFQVKEPAPTRQYRLHIPHSSSICIWLITHDGETVPFNSSAITEEGTYAIQISSRERQSVEYELHGGLMSEPRSDGNFAGVSIKRAGDTRSDQSDNSLEFEESQEKTSGQLSPDESNSDSVSSDMLKPSEWARISEDWMIPIATSVIATILMILCGSFGIRSASEMKKDRTNKKEIGQLWRFWVSNNYTIEKFKSIWLSGIDYAALAGKCQQMRHLSRNRSKFLNP